MSIPRRTPNLLLPLLLGIALLPCLPSGVYAEDEPQPAPKAEAPTEAQQAALQALDAAYKLQQAGKSAEAADAFPAALAQLAEAKAPLAWIARGHHEFAACLAGLKRLEPALEHARKAVELRRKVFQGDDAELATSINNLAYIARSLSRKEEALRASKEALAMRLRVLPKDDPEIPFAYDAVGIDLTGAGRDAEALEVFQAALAVRRRILPADAPRITTSLSQIAIMQFRLGRQAEAVPLLEEALARRRTQYGGDHGSVASAMGNLASAYGALGRSKEALQMKREALAMSRRLFTGDHERLATDLNNVAMSLRDLGRQAESLPLLEDALAMRRRLLPHDNEEVAQSLSNLALILGELGRREEGFGYDEEALAMRRRLYQGDHRSLAVSIHNMGGALQELGRAEEALAHYREAYAMRRRLYEGDHVAFTVSLNNIAHALTKLGRQAEAVPLLEEALAMCRRLFQDDDPATPDDHPETARALNNLGMAYGTAERTEDAARVWREVIAMGERMAWSRRHIPLVGLARQELAAGRAPAAIELLEDAIASIEARRRHARGLQTEGQARFAAQMRGGSDPYPVMVAAQVTAGDTAGALASLERGRARALLDLLEAGRHAPMTEALERARAAGDAKRIEELQHVDASVRDAESALVLASRSVEKAARRRNRPALRKARAAEAAARHGVDTALRQRLFALRDALPEARPLDATHIQGLLAPGERMLAYMLGKRASYVFLVRPHGEPIDAIRLMQDGKTLTPQRTAAAVDAYLQRLETTGSADVAGDVHPGETLFGLLVPARAWAEVRKAPRVYVLPHGALHRLPFEALIVRHGDQGPVHWVDQAPPVAYAPSASVLAWLRGRTDAQGARTTGALTALGDPDFGGTAIRRWPTSGVMLESVAPDGAGARAGLRPGDVIVGVGGAAVTDTAGFVAGLRSAPKGGTVAFRNDRGATPLDLAVPAGTLGIRIAKEPPATAGPKLAVRVATRSGARHGTLAPLPGSRAEVEAIAKAYQHARPDAEVRILLGPDATEAGLVAAVPGARILHLATHGLVDEGGSASFSALALTKPRLPVPGDDGFLTFADLLGRWRARLKHTELVVLSACDSQRGRLEADEGMLSLPLGFSFAGCPRVIGSLWRVDDEATALLMASFYRRWLASPQAGAAAALQAARRELKQNHPDPHHWAPFVLLGDAR